MPLDEGRSWTYSVRTGFDAAVESLKTVRPVAVAGASGMELIGPLGVSRLAWKNDVLYASETVGARFVPALPLCVPVGKQVDYHGRMETSSGQTPASATINSIDGAVVKLGAREFRTVRTTVLLKAGTDAVELITWFAPDVGIVQQEQRTNTVLDAQLQLLKE